MKKRPPKSAVVVRARPRKLGARPRLGRRSLLGGAFGSAALIACGGAEGQPPHPPTQPPDPRELDPAHEAVPPQVPPAAPQPPPPHELAPQPPPQPPPPYPPPPQPPPQPPVPPQPPQRGDLDGRDDALLSE